MRPDLLATPGAGRTIPAIVFLVLGCCALAAAAEPTAEQLEFFERKVRPILVERCQECHSSKLAEPKGGLRTDSLAALVQGGDTGPAVVPGKPKESLLIDAINYGDLYQMPPKSKLPPAEIAILTKWVEQGAPWPRESRDAESTTLKTFDLAQRKADHWCWQPVAAPPLPEVKNVGWVQQPLDRFILARLEQEGFAPAPQAEKRVLIRRAYFDLLGLPPTPEQLAAALEDQSPQWFDKLVDQLLKSPHFGERWGRHWLDLVRYAESRGHEFDYAIPNAWQYRDYVIRALNADVPYDQFVTEHLAGDLLDKPRLHPSEGFNESVLGTGFWFLGEWVHSPVDIRKDETDRFDNMVDVFSKTFLGLTVSCARCHDHKFDAISQADYYALFGFLQSSGYRLARFDTMEQHRQIAEQAAALEADYRVRIAAAWAKSREPVVSQMVNYLSVAEELLQSGVKVESDAARVTLANLDESTRSKVIAAADSQELDSQILVRWVAYLTTHREQPDNLWRWRANSEQDSRALAPTLANESGKWRTVVDYSHAKPAGWLADGVAFGLGPVRPGQIVLSSNGQKDGQPFSVATYGAARREALWNGLTLAAGTEKEPGRLDKWERAGQSIRTPTFELRDGRVHYLVKGAGRVYAVVDSHAMINGPLHGQILKETGGDGQSPIRWITHDLQAYRGHRIHCEFSPQGNEPLEVLAVVEGDKPPDHQPVAPIPSHFLAEQGKTTGAPQEAAKRLQEYAEATLKLLSQDKLTADADAASRAAFIGWMLEQPALFAPSDEAVARAANADIERLASEYRTEREKLTPSIRRESRLALAMWEGSPDDERLLIRGNSKTVGAIVPRRTLEALGGESQTIEHGSGRLELARSLVDGRNPLTSRVMVNRVWHHLMGRGLVPSTDNFGVLGQLPTHPELLDHLALQFQQEGWSVKRLIRSIMLSSTYQMSSSGDARGEQVDPQNLLWRRTLVRRLEGEAIRDAILAVSGRLDRSQFGPSVPVHLTAFMQGRGRPASGPVDGNGRRSVYISIRRNFLSPMMLAFDAPIPFNTIGRRNVSNVPAQALILMNDPLVAEQARVWATAILQNPAVTTNQRIDRMYEHAFGRLPTESETSAAATFLSEQAREYGLTSEQAASDPRVWADLCHVMYNVKEFVFIQ